MLFVVRSVDRRVMHLPDAAPGGSCKDAMEGQTNQKLTIHNALTFR